MSWQESESTVPSVKAVKKSATSGETQKQTSFYPPVPARLPDLNQGYLFNEERLLVTEEKGEKGEQADEAKGAVKLDMDQLFYAGSIIIGETRKALVSYVDLQDKKAKSISKSKSRKRTSTKKKYAQLKVNDQLGGYTVTEVETDHIVFERGGKSIEKSLHDSSKVRIKPPARKKVVSRKKRTTSAKKKVSLGTPKTRKKTVRSKSVRSKSVRKPRLMPSEREKSSIGSRDILPPELR